jgi:cytochrome c1
VKPLLVLLALGVLLGCEFGGKDREAARTLLAQHGCGTCHVIPDTPGANGRTGPPLTAMARQAYVAGVLPNTREALARFIADPQAVDPRSAMPDVGITPDEARLLADYLYAVGSGS